MLAIVLCSMDPISSNIPNKKLSLVVIFFMMTLFGYHA
jgi:hypothetical protein